MHSYIDIEVKPDSEMRENVLMNKVYTKLHKSLFEMQAVDIGVSFPLYNFKLGRVLRIHSSEERLCQLRDRNWLGGLAGYCAVANIQSIPGTVKHRTVSRIQSNMTQSKLKRLLKRGSITDAEVKAYKAKMFSIGLDNPYFELESGSNGHKHRRYVCFGELLDHPVDGEFDSFGFGKGATVPWF
ncbi:MAG: type I-F CRISPR-associated endoribonuclease Cas6/Csy4 [Hahellaceae bacterium]|nr:type I-F CRISPR-associated endoribonuclease Cas6/Csy4 [Hahellaceae bacterium]MCP5212654.1 type I-F CRISPR-associated endoribonuclease Cas6/Csy4 [Hahellaceae bacterium]